MSLSKDDLSLIIEHAADFNSLSLSGCDVKHFIETHNWEPFFEMLNGPSYIELVKDFCVKSEVYDQEVAAKEEAQKPAKK